MCFSYTVSIMNGRQPSWVVFYDGDIVIKSLTQALNASGLRVFKSFDLRSACSTLGEDICPHHKTSPCDCQVAVLLVYELEDHPISLIIHSHRGLTEITCDEHPVFRPSQPSHEILSRIMKYDTDVYIYPVDEFLSDAS